MSLIVILYVIGIIPSWAVLARAIRYLEELDRLTTDDKIFVLAVSGLLAWIWPIFIVPLVIFKLIGLGSLNRAANLLLYSKAERRQIEIDSLNERIRQLERELRS